MTANITSLVHVVRNAKRITVLTGAGVSAASGIPTFRGADGLWHRYRAEQLATPESFERDPKLVWEWYDWRRQKVATSQPNAAHRVLAAWSQRWPTCRIVTQNVDDLQLRAGTRDLVRLHGSIWEVSCWDRCAASPRYWRHEQVPLEELPPRCPHCGGLARPAVVWFGESLDPADVDAAQEAATTCSLFVSAGTSAVVYPAAAFLHEAKRHGATTAEINLEATPASDVVDMVVQGRAEEVLEQIEAALACGAS